MPGSKVLVIEDEAVLREVMAAQLAAAGYEADLAADAEEGLALAKSGHYGLILLDVGLPGMSGLSAVAPLARASGAPVVLVTGHADSELRKDAQALGAAALLAKPLDVKDLAAFLPPSPREKP